MRNKVVTMSLFLRFLIKNIQSQVISYQILHYWLSYITHSFHISSSILYMDTFLKGRFSIWGVGHKSLPF